MSASVITPTRFERAQISEKLRRLDPVLREYRQLIQVQFAKAAETASRDEMNEFGQELAAYDRWRAYDLGRQVCPQVVERGQQ